MERIVARCVPVLIPPDAGKRTGTRPGWDGGIYAFMRRVLDGEPGGAMYAQRNAMIEPVFGNTPIGAWTARACVLSYSGPLTVANSLLHEIYKAPDLARVLSHHLFGGTPEIFVDHTAWIDWRCELADRLGVDDHSVLIVGSAAFGISLNPNNNFRAFAPTSDIDVAVVSQRHFDAAWFELREMRDKHWLSMPRAVKNELVRFAPNYIFSGAIATDKILARLSFGKRWVIALSAMAGIEPTLDRDVKVRLYRDAEALRAYQMRGLRTAREALVSAGGP